MMLVDRSTRMFIALTLLVAGLLIGVNVLLNPDGLGDWAPLVTFVALAGGIAVWLTIWLEDRTQRKVQEAEPEVRIPHAQEWIISKELPPAPSNTSLLYGSATVEKPIVPSANLAPTPDVIAQQTRSDNAPAPAQIEAAAKGDPDVLDHGSEQSLIADEVAATVSVEEVVVEEDPPTDNIVSATVLEHSPESIRQEQPSHTEAADSSSDASPAESPDAAPPYRENKEDTTAQEIVESTPSESDDAPLVAEAKDGELVSEKRVADASAAQVGPTLSDVEGQGAANTAAPGPDNFRVIEGIGPVYNDVLHQAGITTYQQLSETTRDTLEKILRDAGHSRLAAIDTWAEQAALAAAGDWDGLEKMQSTFKGGRRKD